MRYPTTDETSPLSELSSSTQICWPAELPHPPSVRHTPEEVDSLVRLLRDQAAETRGRADKIKSRGARWGLLQLATSYDGRADQIAAMVLAASDAPLNDRAIATSLTSVSIDAGQF